MHFKVAVAIEHDRTVVPGSFRRCKGRLAALLATVLGMASGFFAPLALALDLNTQLAFDIPAQQLSSALIEFGRQTSIQIMTASDDLQGLKAKQVQGTMTVKSALDRLLAGTDLWYQEAGANSVAIAKSAPTDKAVAASATGSGINLAQTEAPSPSQGEGKGEDQKVSSASSEAEKQKIEEIVVTAQKREERLQDVPISVGVLTGEYLDRGTSRGVSDVLAQVGGVSITENSPGTAQIAIRGVLSGIDAGSSAVGYYLDETPFSSVNNGRLPDLNAFDVQRIEVLRGPQGTLYGSNALGGVVRVITNDADLNDRQVHGRLRGSQTEHGGENFQGDLALNLPILPGVLAARAVIGRSDQSGFIDSVCLVTTHPDCGGRDANHTEIDAYRLKVNFQPTDEFSLEFAYHGTEILQGAGNVGTADYTTARTSNQFERRDLDVYNLTAQLDVPGVSFLSSTGYWDLTVDGRGDLAPGFAVFGHGPQHAFSQELRATSDLDGPWQWTAGAFYRESYAQLYQDAHLTPITGAIIVDTDSADWAAFGELTRSFADDKFDLTFGARYFENTITQNHIQNLFFAPVTPKGTVEFSKATWRLVGTYRPNKDLTMYGSVATGFRSGRFQSVSALALFPGLPSVDPDSLITYEVGAKGNLSNRFAYEIAAYYTDWEDIQQTYAVPIATQSVLAFLNAGDASGPGVDATLNYRPTDELTLGFSLGWNDLTLKDDLLASAGTPPTPVLLFIGGDRPNDSPEWTGSFNAEYRTPAFGSDLELVWTGNYTFSTERISRSLNGTTVAERFSDSYSLVNTSIGLEGDHWSLSLFADNLLGEDGAITPPIVGYSNEAVHARPRTIGLQTNFRF